MRILWYIHFSQYVINAAFQSWLTIQLKSKHKSNQKCSVKLYLLNFQIYNTVAVVFEECA